MTTRKAASPPEPQPRREFTQADLDRIIAERMAADAEREAGKRR